MTNYKELKNAWLEEEKHAFQGWDFSYLDGRWFSEPAEMKWDYKFIVKKYLLPTDCLLDMGTGGGEVLLSLGHAYKNTAVTEAWGPNIQLCRAKLAPLGIRVYPVQEEAPLPMADNSFDIVINRHESHDLEEVRRVLKPGGMFVTQQVGGENCADLEQRINLETWSHQPFSLATELPKFRDSGFLVRYFDECFPLLKFFDVGAIVFWAKIISWSFPGFSVERNFGRLCALQNDIVKQGFVAGRQHRFIVVAQNMK